MTGLSPDFREILSSFNTAGVEYLLVGGYALAAHGFPRATGDIDLWVRASRENAQRVYGALAAFGAPTDQVTPGDFEADDLIYQIGLPPARVDVITSIEGVMFDDAWPRRLEVTLDGITVTVIGLDDLIRNKRQVGRDRDIDDVNRLERARRKPK